MSEETNKGWFYINNGKKVGPFSNEDMIVLVKNKIITSRAIVGHKKLGGWKKITETEFGGFFEESLVSKQSRIFASKAASNTSKSQARSTVSPPPLPPENNEQSPIPSIPSESDVYPSALESTAKEWYYADDDGQGLGPFTLQEMIKRIEMKKITSESFVWHRRLGDWKKLRETKLKPFLPAYDETPMDRRGLLKDMLQSVLGVLGVLFAVLVVIGVGFSFWTKKGSEQGYAQKAMIQAKKAALKAKKEEPENQEPRQQIPERNSYQQSQEQTVTPSFEIAATPDEMVNAYEANTVAADVKYKGKRIKIAGTIQDINTDIWGKPYITMKSNKYFFYAPQLRFDKKYLNEISQLRKGEVLEAVCTGNGDIAKIPMLKDCNFHQGQGNTSVYQQESQTGETRQQARAYEESYEPQVQGSTKQTLGESSTDISPLTNAEYKGMLMTSDELGKANYAFNFIYTNIRNHPNFIGIKARDFTEKHLQWMRVGRDQEAHKFIAAGYDRVTAYTKVMAKRAKELYVFLQELNSMDSNANCNTGMSSNARVVIDGTVRMRFEPSLNADWLRWEDGATRTPNRGERLRYLGSEGKWYIVEYEGQRFYVSKMYSHLEC